MSIIHGYNIIKVMDCVLHESNFGDITIASVPRFLYLQLAQQSRCASLLLQS
jgi:hypothetical protein